MAPHHIMFSTEQCSLKNFIVCCLEIAPSARLMVNFSNSLLVAFNRALLSNKNTSAAARAVRLLPATNG